MHGGKATQTHAGNQHALKHGIYGRVLTEEEQGFWGQVELGKVDDELRLCKLRLLRALRAEAESNNGAPELEGYTERPMVVGGVPLLDKDPIKETTYKRRDYVGMVDRLMGRIESLERTRAELMKSAPLNNKNDLLDQLAELLPD